MMDGGTLFETDIEAWAEVQVEALRRLAATPGPWANALDWDNVIEEIEDLGSERRRAAESLLANIFVHALKIAADPDSLSAEHWRQEADAFSKQLRDILKPSMRSRIDLDRIWRGSCRQAANVLEAFDRALPETPWACPFSFDDLLGDAFAPVARVKRCLEGADRP
ncbi:MAG TPA: DUF29 domain-containing protein [Microvirga sp.]|jgi:hypothetical protein|nr:DUF29 domain-containing protein [Microvirga sp.]